MQGVSRVYQGCFRVYHGFLNLWLMMCTFVYCSLSKGLENNLALPKFIQIMTFCSK